MYTWPATTLAGLLLEDATWQRGMKEICLNHGIIYETYTKGGARSIDVIPYWELKKKTLKKCTCEDDSLFPHGGIC